MRYDTPIYFQHNLEPVYDATTGDWTTGSLVETCAYASVANTGEQMVSLVYGQGAKGGFSVCVDSLTAHIQNHYDAAFETIRIGTRVYKVDKRFRLKTKEAFVLSEVQHASN